MARSGHNFVLQNVLSWMKDGDRRVHVNLESIRPIDLRENHLKWGGPKLLIWRDFDDWLASSIMKSFKTEPVKKEGYMPNYIKKIITAYDAIMQEAKRPHYYKNSVVIHYDEFVEFAAYRQDICSKIRGEYSEEKLNFVPPNGHHSSFDGDKFKQSGSKMNVLNRVDDILNSEHAGFYLAVMKQYGR